MSIDLVNSGDGWFNRQGVFAGSYNYTANLYGSGNDTVFQSIWSLFATSDQAAVQTLPDALAGWRTTGAGYCNVFAADAQQASILQVTRNIPVNNYTFPTSVEAVAAQMVATAQSIKRPTLTSAVVAGGSNLGDTKIFVSTTNIYGDPLDMTLNEVLAATCTSQGSGFGSSFSVIGQPVYDPTAWNWPGGSGTVISLSTVDPAIDGIISNSSLSTFTVTNTPDSWTILNGAAGVTVFESANGGVRSATNAAYLQSDGSQATQLAQTVSLAVNTVYAVTFQVKMNSNSASGSLIVELYDATNSQVLENDAGTQLLATYALNGGAGEVTTSYQLLTVFFSTPRQLPASVQLRVGYGVAGVSTRQLFLCNVQVFQATPLYGPPSTGTAGPFAMSVANVTRSAVGDSYTITFTNSLTNQSFVWGLQRLHDFRSLGIYLPSNTSPTILDSLVTH